MNPHPSSGTQAERAASSAALQDRISRVMQRVADDPRQSRKVRAANTRDAATARTMADRMRSRV